MKYHHILLNLAKTELVFSASQPQRHHTARLKNQTSLATSQRQPSHAVSCIPLHCSVGRNKPLLTCPDGASGLQTQEGPCHTSLDLAPLVTFRSKHQIQVSGSVVENFHLTSTLLRKNFHKSLCTILCSQ